MNTSQPLDNHLQKYFRHLRHVDSQQMPPVLICPIHQERPAYCQRILSSFLHFSLGVAASAICLLAWYKDQSFQASDLLRQITYTSFEDYPADVFYPNWTDSTTVEFATEVLLQPFSHQQNHPAQPN